MREDLDRVSVDKNVLKWEEVDRKKTSVKEWEKLEKGESR